MVGNQVLISWSLATDAVGVSGYKVWRDNAQVGITPGTAYADDSPVIPGAAYTYAISAYDAAGNESAKSTLASITIPGGVNPALSAPIPLPTSHVIPAPTPITPRPQPIVSPAQPPELLPTPLPAKIYPSNTLVNDGGTLYLIEGILKIQFTSIRVLKGLGYDLNNLVTGDTRNYTVASTKLSTITQAHPSGSWLSYRSKIYYTTATGLIPVLNKKMVLDNGGLTKYIVPMSASDLTLLKTKRLLPPMVKQDKRVGR
jgi:hypothetical protein